MVTVGNIDFLVRALDEFTQPIKKMTDALKPLSVGLREYHASTDAINVASRKAFKSVTGLTDAQLKNLPVVEEGVKKYKRWSMEFLGMGFFAQMLSKQFGFLNEKVNDLYFSGELLNIQFTMMLAAAPFFDALGETFYNLADAFYNLPEPVQGALGALTWGASQLFGFLSTLGFSILGLQAFAKAFGGISTAITNFSLPLAAGLAMFAKLALAVGIAIGIVWGFVELLRFLGVDLPPFWVVLSRGVEVWVGNFTHNIGYIQQRLSAFGEGWRLAWEATADFFGHFQERVGTGLQGFADHMKGIIDNIVIWFQELPGRIWDAIASTGEAIVRAGQATIEWFQAGLGGIGGALGGLFQGGGMRIFQGLTHPITFNRPEIIGVHPGETLSPRGGAMNFNPTINITATLSSPMDIREIGRQLVDSMRSELVRSSM